MEIRPLFDKVLVIAFQEQPPFQDGEIVANLEDHIQHYLLRLQRITKSPETWSSRRIAGVPLYEPSSCLLWGEYDYATFYLGDDLESVASISIGCGAIAQEFLFGSPYALEESDDACLSTIRRLFQVDADRPRPLVAITRLKLGDHLLPMGVDLRRAVAKEVHRVARDAQVEPLVLRCWSWPEIIVILLADQPDALVKATQQIDHFNLQALCDRHSGLKEAMNKALEHDVPRRIWQLWVQGHAYASEDQVPSEELSTRNLRDEILKRHAVVATRTQIGILKAGWPGEYKKDPASLMEAIAHAFSPGNLAGVEQKFTYKQILDELTELRKNEVDQLLAGGDRLFSATVTMQAKPGHAEFVFHFAEQVCGALNKPLADLSRELKNRHSALVRGGSIGQEASLILTLPVASSFKGFCTLLCVSHSFRICSIVRHDLLTVTTLLDWPKAHLPEYRSRQELAPVYRERVEAQKNSAPSRPNGYRLFSSPTPLHPVDFERKVFRRYGVGRVEGRSLRAWFSSINHVTTRPEMLSSMIEVYRAARCVRANLIVNEPTGSEESKRSVAHNLLAAEALDVGEYLQRAYQQRLQFSPIMSGAPQINGQLPYGVSQIVKMLDGVVSVIMQAAFLAEERVPSEWRSTLVVFGPGSSLTTNRLLSLRLLQLNLLQAWTPLSLCALFHELGHSMVSWQHWCHADGCWEFFYRKRQEWRHSLSHVCEYAQQVIEEFQAHNGDNENVAEDPDDLAVGHDEDGDFIIDFVSFRVPPFLEDVFSHAVWRRIGCKNDWDVFVIQFMAARGMGLRNPQNSRPPLSGTPTCLHDPNHIYETLAEVIAHLVVQKIFQQANDVVEKAFELLYDFLEKITDGDDSIIREMIPFVDGELHFCHSFKPWSSQKEDVVDSLRRFLMSTWIPVLHAVCMKHELNRAYRESLSELFDRLNRLENKLDTEYENVKNDSDFKEIAKNVKNGESVVDRLPWQMLDKRDGEYSPSALAVLWVREILLGMTQHFRDAKRQPKGWLSVRRDSNLDVDSERGTPEGIFVDFIGGLFVAGHTTREEYLRIRLAATESLSAVAARVLSASVRSRLERSRRYLRYNIRGDERVTVRLPDHRTIDLRVLDQSPISVGAEAFCQEDADVFRHLLNGRQQYEVEGNGARSRTAVVFQAIEASGERAVSCRVIRVQGLQVAFERWSEGGLEPEPLNVTRWLKTENP